MRRLTVMVTPAASEAGDSESTAVSHIDEVAEELDPYPMVPRDPMAPPMCSRDEIILRIFVRLVEALVLRRQTVDNLGKAHQNTMQTRFCTST